MSQSDRRMSAGGANQTPNNTDAQGLELFRIKSCIFLIGLSSECSFPEKSYMKIRFSAYATAFGEYEISDSLGSSEMCFEGNAYNPLLPGNRAHSCRY